MESFILRSGEETRPFRRGKSVVAFGAFIARVLANTMLVAFLIALGWSLATGNVTSLHI